MGEKMQNDLNVLMNTWSWVPGGFMDYLLENVGDMAKHMDHNYVGEMRGLANASGLTLDDIVFFNVIYELSAACTSIGKRSALNHKHLNLLQSHKIRMATLFTGATLTLVHMEVLILKH